MMTVDEHRTSNAERRTSNGGSVETLSIPGWRPATDPPSTPRVVIATDLEGQWMAVYDAALCKYIDAQSAWFNAETEEPFDSVITHWTEQLPLPDNV